MFPFLETIFADSAYGGPKLAKAIAGAAWKIGVVKKPKDQKGFEVLTRRWVVERTIRLDQPLPAIEQRFRKSQPHSSCLHPSRFHQAYAAKARALLCSFINFRDGLYDSAVSSVINWFKIGRTKYVRNWPNHWYDQGIARAAAPQNHLDMVWRNRSARSDVEYLQLPSSDDCLCPALA